MKLENESTQILPEVTREGIASPEVSNIALGENAGALKAPTRPMYPKAELKHGDVVRGTTRSLPNGWTSVSLLDAVGTVRARVHEPLSEDSEGTQDEGSSTARLLTSLKLNESGDPCLRFLAEASEAVGELSVEADGATLLELGELWLILTPGMFRRVKVFNQGKGVSLNIR